MTRALLVLALVLCATPADAGFLKWPRSVRIGLICSVGADAYDAVSTAYFIGRNNGLVEGNPLLRDAARSPWKLTATKIALAIPINYAGLYWAERKPWLGHLLLYGNCAAKTFIGARNERLQNQIDRR
jgi:hypothetical protein